MVRAGGLTGTLTAMLADKAVYRSPEALGPGYEDPQSVTDADIGTYLRPFLRTPRRTTDLARFITAFDNRHTLAIEPQPRVLKAPTLIALATNDVFFSMKWAQWLADTIPGAKPPVLFEGARIFFPEERADAFNAVFRRHVIDR